MQRTWKSRCPYWKVSGQAGWLIAALIAYFVIPAIFWPIEGWRVALLITAIPAFYAIYIRMQLPDSPQFTAKARSEKT